MKDTPTESWEKVVCNCNDELNASSEHTDRCAVPLMRRYIAVEKDEAYRKGREDAVEYIRPRWHAVDAGKMSGDIDDHCDAARHAGEVTGIKSSDANDGRTS